MWTNINSCHISRMIPFRLSRHIIRDNLTIYAKVLKTDISYLPLLIIPFNYGNFSPITSIRHILEHHIFNPSSRCLAIFLIKENTKIHQLPLPEVFNTYIFKAYIPYQILITRINCQTTLIVQLFLLMIQNINVHIVQILQNLRFVHISMNSDKNRMRHISP